MGAPVLSFERVWKSYPQPGGTELHALADVSIAVESGDVISIVGRSGSGKSTFLHLAAGIDEPTRGEVRLGELPLASASDRERALARRDRVGLVFQFFHLLPHLTVRENVALPAIVAGDRRRAWAARSDELLDAVGLLDRADDAVPNLSGGEQQRVAIARALLRRPTLLLADEPTGSLDDETGRRVLDLMRTLADREGSALVYVTHSAELAGLADRKWRMHSGVLDRA